MITIPEIEKRFLERSRTRLAELEKDIDDRLEAEWGRGAKSGIRCHLPEVPRLLVDELARRYRLNNSWQVEYESSTPALRAAGVFDVLVFSRYSERSFSGKD